MLPPETLKAAEPIPVYLSHQSYEDKGFAGEIVLSDTPYEGIMEAAVTVEWFAGRDQPRRLQLSRFIRMDEDGKK
jgi:hypothetical protein